MLNLKDIRIFKDSASYLKKMASMKEVIGKKKLEVKVGDRYKGDYKGKTIFFMPIYIDPKDADNSLVMFTLEKTLSVYFTKINLDSLFKNKKLSSKFQLASIKKLVKPVPTLKKDLKKIVVQIQALKASDLDKTNNYYVSTRNPKLYIDCQYLLDKVDSSFLLKFAEKVMNAYYTGKTQSPLSDDHYDDLKEYLIKTKPKEAAFLKKADATIAPTRNKITLQYPMGSLDKIKPDGVALPKFLSKAKDSKYVLSDKLDGLSFELVYENGELDHAATRGKEGLIGQDITRHVKSISSVPKKIKFKSHLAVRAEGILSNADFAKLQETVLRNEKTKEKFKNARNMIAGLVNRTETELRVFSKLNVTVHGLLSQPDVDKDKQLKFLKDLGFQIVSHKVLDSSKITETSLSKYIQDRKAVGGHEMDGAVLEANSAKIRKKLGNQTNSLNPDYARAFKIGDTEQVEVVVKHVEWNPSKHGFLKPRIRLTKPVTLSGVEVEYATAFNAAFVRDNKLGPGAKVLLTRSGDVIPHIIKVIAKAPKAQMPDVKIFGIYEWNATNVDVVLPKGHNNATVRIKSLADFFASIGAEFFGAKMIEKFIQEGFDDIDKILGMTVNQMLKIDGVQQKMAEKIYNNIRKGLTDIPLPKLAAATPFFGINFGERRMQTIYDELQEKMFDWKGYKKGEVVARIESIKGFSEKTARQFVDGVKPFNAFMKRQSKLITIKKPEAKKSSKLKDKSFCFTGYRNKQVEDIIKANGGQILNSVSKGLTYLVAKDPDSGSTKLQKAISIGVKVIGVPQLEKILKGL